MNRLFPPLIGLIAVILGFCLIPKSSPALDISGRVSGLLRLQDSPFIVTNTLFIPGGEELRVEPGVELRFNRGIPLYVFGRILAVGTEEDSIFFTHNSDQPDFTWLGIRGHDVRVGSRLEYCVLEFAAQDSARQNNNGGALYTDLTSQMEISRCTFRNNSGYLGGAVYMAGALVLLSNSSFENNLSHSGAGLAIQLDRPVGRTINLRSNRFVSNHAVNSGGALFVSASRSDLRIILGDNIIEDNTAEQGGGFYLSGVRSSFLSGNRFLGNQAQDHSGALYISGETMLSQNTFLNNSVTEGAGGVFQLGYRYSSTKGVCWSYANTIVGNRCPIGGIVFVSEGSSWTSFNDLIYDNEVTQEGSLVCLSRGSLLSMRNCIVQENSLPEGETVINQEFRIIINVIFSDIQGGWDGEGNLDEAPEFVNPDEGDYRLTEDSPGFDAGNPSDFYLDEDDSRNDMGSQGGRLVFPDAGILDFGRVGIDVPDTLAWRWFNFSGEDAFFINVRLENDNYRFLDPDLEIPPFSTVKTGVEYTPAEAGGEPLEVEMVYGTYRGDCIAHLNLAGQGIAGIRGEVAGNWTIDDSPVFIVGETLVPNGEELVIDPGVAVQIVNQSALIINGSLIAEGTEEDSIRFTNAFEPRRTWGRGIRFIGADSRARLDYVVIENQIQPEERPQDYCGGLRIEGGEHTIDHSCIRNCEAVIAPAIFHLSGRCVIRNSSFTGNSAQNNSGILGTAGLKLIDCLIRGNRSPENLSSALCLTQDRPVQDSIVVTGCRIEHNQGIGVSLQTCNCPSHFAYNEITFNTEPGIVFWSHGPSFQADHCTIYGNLRGAAGEGYERETNLLNSILWGNIEWDFYQPGAWDWILRARFCDIGSHGGIEDIEESIFEDPMFFDPEGLVDGTPDFRLRAGSPCIGAGENGTDIGAHLFERDEVVQVIPLIIRWNGAGLFIRPETEDIIEIFAPLVQRDHLDLVKNPLGRFYAPRFNFNNIPRWEYYYGYAIRLSAADTLEVPGLRAPQDEPIDLRAGWNFMSYYPEEPMQASWAFREISDIVLLAKDFSGRFWAPWHWGWPNFTLQPNGAYFIKLTQDVRYVYPEPREGQQLNYSQNQAGENWDRLLSEHQIAITDRNMSCLVKCGGFEPGGYILAAPASNPERVVGLGVACGEFAPAVIYGDDPYTTETDGLPEGEAFNLYLAEGGTLKDLIIKQSSPGNNLVYETNGLLELEVEINPEVPCEFYLAPVYPNPFNASAQIKFGLPEKTELTICIYDAAGRRTEVLADGEFDAGNHSMVWKADKMPAGIYILRVETPAGLKAAQKVILVK